VGWGGVPSSRLIGNDGRLQVQIDQTEARTLHLVHDIPLAIVVHERPVRPFWSQRWQGLWSDLSAVAAHAPRLRGYSDGLEPAARKFHVHVVPAVVQHVTALLETQTKARFVPPTCDELERDS
jgi:hypothetical protein